MRNVDVVDDAVLVGVAEGGGYELQKQDVAQTPPVESDHARINTHPEEKRSRHAHTSSLCAV